ncbi:MAG: hypothetical protein JSV03_13085, partial [Planctomycetota bacterium]
MSITTKRHYNIRRVNFIFACSCLALLAGIIWWIKVDHYRPWRKYQDDYFKVRTAIKNIDWLSEEKLDEEDIGDSPGPINLPLFDFLAPKDTPGTHAIKQVILPDIRCDLHFTETYTTDRCMTCHAGIDDGNM